MISTKSEGERAVVATVNETMFALRIGLAKLYELLHSRALDSYREGASRKIGTASAESLLQRMQAKVEGFCEQRDRLLSEQGRNLKSYASGKRIKGTPAHRRA